MGNKIKLSEWAKQNGYTYKGAYLLLKRGGFPLPVQRLSTGTILVELPDQVAPGAGVALYARVSSHDQAEDLQRQLGRLRDFAASRGLQVTKEVSEVGSGLNGKRPKLLALLKDPAIKTLIVEHPDRLARFGVEYITGTLEASGRSLVVINETESKMDLVQDFVDVVTSMCARIYGRRSASNRAKRALEAAQQ